MKLLPLALSSLLATSAGASGLAELQSLAGSVELPAPAAVVGAAVPAPAAAPARSDWAALAAETVRRGDCRSPSDDPDFRDPTTYCTTVIDAAQGFWGGHRAYVSVADGASIHYHAQTPTFLIGYGASSGQEFRAVDTVTIDVGADGRVRSVVKTVMLPATAAGACPNASRSDSFLVRDGAGSRTVTVCTHRLPYEREEHPEFVEEAQRRWSEALAR